MSQTITLTASNITELNSDFTQIANATSGNYTITLSGTILPTSTTPLDAINLSAGVSRR
jgi:hypothetical protein